MSSEATSSTEKSTVKEVFKKFDMEQDEIEQFFHPGRAIRWCYRHFWLIALGPLLLLVVLDVLRGMVDTGTGGMLGALVNISAQLLVDLTDWVFLSVTLLLLIGGFVYGIIVKRTPGVFYELAESGRLEVNEKPPPNTPLYTDFPADFEKDLKSPWRVVLTVVLLLVVVGFVAFTDRYYAEKEGYRRAEVILQIFDPAARDRFSTILYLLWDSTRWVLAPLLWALVGSRGAWVVSCIARAIRRLTPTFELDVQPGHPDRAGGLRRLGDLCFNMALPLLVGIVLLSFWAAVRLATESVSPVSLFSIVGLILLVPTSVVVFIVPLLDIHEEMLEKRTEYQDTLARHIATVEERLQEHIESDAAQQPGGDDDEIENLTRQLEALEKLHPSARKYPTWPFDTAVFLRFISPQVAPFIALVIGLQDKGAALKGLLESLNKLIGAN
jgi:hypothetical protein